MTKQAAKIKTMVNLEAGDCKWPIGDPRHAGFHFCGARQAEGRPYCVAHWEISFIPGRTRQQQIQARAQALSLVVLPSSQAA